MSVIAELTSLGDGNIARVLAEPASIWRVLSPDDPEAYETARAPRWPSLLGRLLGRGRAAPPSEAPSPFALQAGEGEQTDLDKAWHGIHYLLTGSAAAVAGPLSFLMGGGRQVGNVDVGYGPARVLSAAETRAVHEALSDMTDADLRARFDPAAMTRDEVYPEIWEDDAADEDSLEYLMEYVGVLREFLRQVVARGHGLVIRFT